MKKSFPLTHIVLLLAVSACTDPASRHYILKYDEPATRFIEAFPMGNGTTGAIIYGGVDKERISLNDISLWSGEPYDPLQDSLAAEEGLAKVREALSREDYRAADTLALRLQGPNSNRYMPMGNVRIDLHNDAAASDYLRTLDIRRGVARVEYNAGGVKYARETFVSHPDGVVVMKFSADGGKALNMDLSFDTPLRFRTNADGSCLLASGYAPYDKDYSYDPERGTRFAVRMRICRTDGEVSYTDTSAVLRNASEAVLVISEATSFNGFDKHPVKEGAAYIEQVADDAWHLVNYTYDQLRQRHIDDYKAIYDRFQLSLGDAVFDTKRTTAQQLKDYTDNKGGNTYLETLYAQYGRYLLISCSRTPGVPANLQGLWTPHLWSPWRGNYTVNINLEENYWPAEVANMQEMAMPLDNFIAALAENGKYTAKNYYGITEGWCSSHNSDIWAMTNPVGEKREWPEWANWNMGGAWLVNALWDHYLFSLDTDYLRSTAYPLMKGAAEFCMAWLIPNPNKPDELITSPSTSPENEYKTDKGYHGMTMYGGTADLAIIRELLINTIKAAEELGIDKELRTKMSSCIDKLHPYQIGSRGNLQEWYYDWEDWDWKHRHQSHLIGLYPGRHITNKHENLMKACRKSLEIKGDETTGWSTGWRINLWARLKDAEQAYHIYQKLLTYVSPDNYNGEDKRRSGGTYPNLFDAHPPFQIDGNFGGTAGVCEMLVQSDGNIITLLPALPKVWSKGSVTGIRARGGYELSMKWENSMVTELKIKSVKKGSVKLHINGRAKTIKTKAGKTTRVI